MWSAMSFSVVRWEEGALDDRCVLILGSNDESSNHFLKEDEDKHRKDRLYATHFSSSLLNFPNVSAPSGSLHPAGDSARESLARMLLVATLLAAGIYPDGHWTRATKLTPANFEGFVESQVDAGKTLFVRWIASEG